ncbi:hypothetical protein FAUST_1469 [Fusarium austroamericanum]|uniref:RBR-type E3 ubiquitin transferase n=1 Tax=Fusarium austroamericanum TaxID=282268 RepID=A0AAN6HJN8_FUSAU|nr:hypothetical protein FAUST_1469 [Fusarium austroamericanum]
MDRNPIPRQARRPKMTRSARVPGKRARSEFETHHVQENDPAPTIPSSPSVRRATRLIKTKECLACGEDFPQSSMIFAPCSHLFCKPCADNLVSLAMRDEAYFPARCCDAMIPVTLSNGFSNEVVTQYNAKAVEFAIPSLGRVYCSSEICATFIPPTQIDSGIGHCKHCLTDTCIACKAKAHEGVCGHKDEDVQGVLRLAQGTGWKRCSKCGHVIEKSMGCDHMVCLCGHRFCYACGKDAGKCACDEVPVDVPMPPHAANPPCNNHRWGRILQPENCEDCGKAVQGYNIFICRGCAHIACLACRRRL